MINDRVTITGGSVHLSKGTVVCYKPKLDENNQPILNARGNLLEFAKVGYVKIGEVGTISGHIYTGPASCLEKRMNDGGCQLSSDTVELVPVFLDKYQAVGWFPILNISLLT